MAYPHMFVVNPSILSGRVIDILCLQVAKPSDLNGIVDMDGHTSPPPDDTAGPALLYALFPPFGLAVLVWAIRIWSRARVKLRLTSADYAITIAIVCETCFFPASPPLV